MNTHPGNLPEPELDSVVEQRIKDLLRGVAEEELAKGTVQPSQDVLSAVQHKLRVRSGGKFYEEGWSTARHGPIATYFITSLIMLAILMLAYFILQPLSGRPETVRSQPAPVEVVVPVRPTGP